MSFSAITVTVTHPDGGAASVQVAYGATAPWPNVDAAVHDLILGHDRSTRRGCVGRFGVYDHAGRLALHCDRRGDAVAFLEEHGGPAHGYGLIDHARALALEAA